MESIIKKLLVQFRFNFDYLGDIKGNPYCPHLFLKEAAASRAVNLDGSPVRLPADGTDPFGLDRPCHLNSFFAYGYPLRTYDFRDDGYRAHNHVTYEAFSYLYGIYLFDLLKRQYIAPIVFPTDYNFYEESLTTQFVTSGKYANGYILPLYHQEHQAVFSGHYFASMGYDYGLLALQYKVADYPAEVKDAIVTINFALTMLFNIVLVESALVDVFGWKGAGQKFSITGSDLAENETMQVLLLFLLSSMHSFVYICSYGLFRNRYGMRNNLPLITPHGSFYYGTDAARKPFKEVLEGAIRTLILHKYKHNSLGEEERVSLLQLSALFGIGYSTNIVMGEANKHFWDKVDYAPDGVCGGQFVAAATMDSPLWRLWYDWWGPYWDYKGVVGIIRQEQGLLEKQIDKRLTLEVVNIKYEFLYNSSLVMKKFLKKKINDPALPLIKKKIFTDKYKEKWDDSV